MRRWLVVVAILLGSGVLLVATAANSVPSSAVGSSAQAIGANNLKPSSCSGITVTVVTVGTTGTGNADLLLGSATGQTHAGGNGNDCILGGGGNDSLNGQAGTDVCIGGPGTDTFNASCETQIQ